MVEGSQSAAHATKSAHQDSHRAALPMRFITRALPKTTSLDTSQNSEIEPLAVPKVHNSLHLPGNQSTPNATTKPFRSPPLRATNSDRTKPESVHGAPTRASFRNANPDYQYLYLRACAVEMHFDNLKVNKHTVKSSDPATDGCGDFDQNPGLTPAPTVRASSVTTLFGEFWI